MIILPYGSSKLILKSKDSKYPVGYKHIGFSSSPNALHIFVLELAHLKVHISKISILLYHYMFSRDVERIFNNVFDPKCVLGGAFAVSCYFKMTYCLPTQAVDANTCL